METLIKQIYAQAKHLRACELFTGNEKTLDDIVALFVSPEGMAFCMKNHFPNMATFRLFKKYDLRRYGIYIDAGVITINNPERAIIIGRTSATINCSSSDKGHEITLIHGSKAIVNASKWAVVCINIEAGCNVIRNTNDNAIII